MAIETLEDYNAQASCCCPQILCPIPVLECQTRSGDVADTYKLPFSDPGSGEIPRVYTSSESRSNSYFDGTIWTYNVQIGGTQIETLQITVWSEDADFDGTAVSTSISANEYNEIEDTCGPTEDYTIISPPDPSLLPYDPVSDGPECTETSAYDKTVELALNGSAIALQGCPGPFNGGENLDLLNYNIQRISYDGTVISGPVTKAGTIADAIAAMDEDWSDTSSCEASTHFTHGISQARSGWPTQESVISLLNTPPGTWFDCENIVRTLPIWCYVAAWRFRFVIPATWSDPVTGATAPFPGTYFKITYDILEEPDGWDDPSPTVFRSFVSEDNVLEWTGPGDPMDSTTWIVNYATDDGWITIDPPAVPGTIRIVNVRFVCREDWGLGVLPQVWGEAVALPDPEP